MMDHREYDDVPKKAHEKLELRTTLLLEAER